MATSSGQSGSERRLPIVIPGGNDVSSSIDGAANNGGSRSGTPSTSRPGPSAGSARVVMPGSAGPAAAGSGGSGAVVQRPYTNTIGVNACQKGNPLIDYIRNVAWEYSDILADYQVGATTGVLYLSLRYHRLHPEYVHGRIQKLGKAYLLRVLLVQVDVKDPQEVIKELTKVAVINDLTIMCAWSAEEAATYVEKYKAFERKPPDLIKERRDNDYMSHMNAVLTNVKGINKTDVVTLTSNFGSLKEIVLAPPESLLACPGLGEKKVKRLREAFTSQFVVKPRKSNAEKRGETGPSLN
ncbi:DNA repair protein rad10 [Cystobasidium minutum MCA 4210]|uniref:DNA repair protein rad10 n=1 Tax=Cystobasidium minutum MCA 4210 TaxID=1397322 RepID=UPI0034D01947|eukprot:jgi/Rhomi1/163643/estExt_Genewise1Plus.C_80257